MESDGERRNGVSALSLKEAHVIIKEMIATFDTESNRKRLAEAILAAKHNPDDIILKATVVAIDIASTAMIRAGLESSVDTFIELMTTVAELAARDEELAFHVYILKCKFLPYPPDERLSPGPKRKFNSSKHALTFANRITAIGASANDTISSSSFASSPPRRVGGAFQLPPLQTS
uniref:Uncharacterized protein n=1 Tax=Aureoumbra lagunensis TaxID=44058 RepID=A0A7S3NPQ3_9STRA|mmetsp:Transcript_21509/g.26763  ORF Transcript_21509/g.26763 Transcript_21509/m.26763 type:complete len:176 (-) Transcript_21509:108-635(-)